MKRDAKTPTQPLQAAQYRTLQQHAYQELRAALMAGRFEPGQKLTIRGLAEALQISPTPIREALHRLTAEGALRLGVTRRLTVPRLSTAEFRELRDIRLELEGLATARAVPLLTDGQVKQLAGLDADIRRRRLVGDIYGTIQSIQQFHHTLYAAAQLPTLKHLIEGLWLRSGPYLRLLFPEYASKEQGASRARTLEAIERRDPAGARAAMQDDLNQTADYLIERLSAWPSGDEEALEDNATQAAAPGARVRQHEQRPA